MYITVSCVLEDIVVDDIQIIQRLFSGYVNILGDTRQCKIPLFFAKYLLFIYRLLVTFWVRQDKMHNVLSVLTVWNRIYAAKYRAKKDLQVYFSYIPYFTTWSFILLLFLLRVAGRTQNNFWSNFPEKISIIAYCTPF